MQRVSGSLWRFWFQPAPADRLAVLRVFIGGYALWYVYTRWNLICDLAHKSGKLWKPVGLFRILGDPMDPVAVDWMVAATLITGMMFVLGWMYRYSGPAFALLLYATLCYRNSWSMIYHMHNLLVVHVLVLGFVRAADDFSLDAWLRRRRGLSPAPPPPAPWEYGWPIKLICALTAIGYFLAGVAKIMGPSGIMWASGEVMRDQIAVDTIRKEVLEGGGMDAAFVLYDQVWLFTVMGVLTLVIELGAPLFLFGRRASRLWALATLGMHWGIYFIMGIKFRYQLSGILFLSFFHVEWIHDWCRATIRQVSSAFGFWGDGRSPVESQQEDELGSQGALEAAPHAT